MNPTLRRQLIRLGSENPNLRPAIRQIVTAAAEPKMIKRLRRSQAPKGLRPAIDDLHEALHVLDKAFGRLTWEFGEFSDEGFGYQAKEFPVTLSLNEDGILVYLGTRTFREWSVQDVVKRLSGSKGVENAARAVAIKKAAGFSFALEIDKAPRDDTRKAAIREGNGYDYARYVDEAPRDDTRKAAIKEGEGYWYALEVDKGPHDDTRKAAIREGNGYDYARYVDKAPHPDTRAAAIREGKQKKYEAAFGPS